MNATTLPPIAEMPPFARRVERLKPSTIREILRLTEASEVISFAGGLPAPELFPVGEIAEICAEILRLDGAAALQYGLTEGYRPLREQISARLSRTGLRCEPEEILITNGSQQGLDLLGRVLLDPGDLVIVEDPSYVGALQTFGACEVDFLSVPVDDQGLCPEALTEVIRTAPRRPKLLYTIPNFQNPTGVSMSVARREKIVAIAAEFEMTIVEDDPYGALRYSGTPAPVLTGMKGYSRGVYLGTASKIMAPGLRVAWMVVPDASLFHRLMAAKQAADLHTSSLTQRIVAQFMESGRLESHIGELIPAYGRRLSAMLDALAAHFPDGCDWTSPDGGLFLWVRVPEQLDTMELLREAIQRRVAFVPGSTFWVEKDVRNTLRLNFSNATETRIEEGIRCLGEAIRAMLDPNTVIRQERR